MKEETVESKMKGRFMNDNPEYREVNFRDNAQYSHTGDNVGRDKIEYYFYGSKFADRPKKKFTNKKLIIPFTKSDANEAQGGTYVPREDLLGQISDCYRSQTGKKRLVFLSGMGGCGKSELAKAYAERHSEEYNEIFWLTCKDGINQNLMGLMADAEILCMPEKEDIYRFSDKVLIIVDNCNSNNARLLTDLERATGDADILVTTRLSRIGNYRQLIPVESDDEKVFAYLVFEKNYCRISIDKAPKEIKRSDVNFINEICQDVLYNTMMVSLIAVCLREYSDYTIAEYAAKIRDGISKLEDRTKYGKDQENKDGAIKEILQFLFSDILHHKFTEAEKTVITVLSLAPASWYEMDFINSICRKADGDSGSKYALKTLQDLGWLQGHSERVSIHPLIAEVISSQDIVFRTPDFFEGLVENYLGMPDQYLGMERFMINKILSFGKSVSLEKRLAVMLLINNKEEYDKVFAELYPDVNAAYTVYVNHNGRRFFLYQDIEKNDTHQFCDVPCREEEGIQAELLRIINKGVSYSLDLSTVFYEKEIRNIPFGLCYKDSLLIGCVFSRKLETIGNRAFENCTGFSGELNLSECLVSIGDKAFEGCNKLNGELMFPKSLRSIGNRAFSGVYPSKIIAGK